MRKKNSKHFSWTFFNQSNIFENRKTEIRKFFSQNKTLKFLNLPIKNATRKIVAN